MKANILGTDWEINQKHRAEDAALEEVDGYCDNTAKRIVYIKAEPTGPMDVENFGVLERKKLRHELIHAMLFESGLAENSEWAQHEEMIDWFAIQYPKLARLFAETDAITAEDLGAQNKGSD